MAFGKNPRMDSRKSSSNCSMTIVIGFVSLCLLGVWMMTSSTIEPAGVSISDTKEQVPGSNSKALKDNSGDEPEDEIKRDTNIKVNTDANESIKEYADRNSVKANNDPLDESETKKNTGNQVSSQDNIKEKNYKGKIKYQISGEQSRSSEYNSKEQKQSGAEKEPAQNDKSDVNTMQDERDQGQTEEKAEQSPAKEVFLDKVQPELFNETNTNNSTWATQDTESKNEKEIQSSSSMEQIVEHNWKLCDAIAGADYIPCLDNEPAIKKLLTTMHYEHRERHCPEEAPTCLVGLPDGYKQPIPWPLSRNKIWYKNTPYTQLSVVKASQNWVKVTGEYLTFPGGGTQFKHGALHYIDTIQQALPDIAWGKQSRTILDVGCGVASFGGYLFDRDVLTMSLAPKDEHEAQVQFALERGIPAISAVMGTKRLPYPSLVFDVIHCARCRVPWHIDGGMLLLELNRLLRPGGYFVWSATPVYQKLEEDVEIWNAMSSLTKSMCWKMVSKTLDKINGVGFAIYRKPSDNACYHKRMENNPALCEESDDPNAVWNVPLQACIHKLPVDPSLRGSQWPEQWPLRLEKVPYWINNSQVGVYGKNAPKDFQADYEHWKLVVSNSYLNGIGISWTSVRNVMDMRAVYGGFAAALRDMKVWVMNVVSIDSPDTLSLIYERGLFGMYHDWCESFSTYPRSYDLLHADHLFSEVKKRCKLLPVIAEVDRILRPYGKLIIRDDAETISQLEIMAKSLHWNIKLVYSMNNEGLLSIEKTMWRPEEVESSTPAAS